MAQACFRFGKLSLSRLEGVHPDLRRVLLRAINDSDMDFSVLEGLRSTERQRQLYAQGRTAPGKVVTWTMESKHRAQKDGYSHAADVAPFPLDWNDAAAFDRLSGVILAAAKAEGVAIRWGGNWDGDDRPHEKGEGDGPHYELVV